MRETHPAGLAWTTLLIFTAASGQAESTAPDYTREVQPIFEENCSMCHGGVEQKGGLRLDRRDSAARAISSGEIIRRITSKDPGVRMPPWSTAPSLTPAQVDTVKRWVAAEAPWAGTNISTKTKNLLEAIDGGATHVAMQILARNPSIINSPDTDGTTPLMHAVLNGDPDCTRLLLGLGADPNSRNNYGATALIWAIDDPLKVSQLLKAGADVKIKSNHGTTALLAASMISGNGKVIRKLIARGSDVNAMDSDGWTPLSKAAGAGDSEVVRLLLAKGARIDFQTATLTPMTAAAWYGNTEVLRTLLNNGAGVNTRDGFDLTPLAAALLFDREDIVRLLLDKGADLKLDVKGPFAAAPGTPLMIAAYTETVKPNLVNLLLQRGANAMLPGADKQTALDRALAKGDTPVLRALLKPGEVPPAFVVTAARTGRRSDLPDIHTAVERSLSLLQKADGGFFDQTGCKSCHNQSLPAMAFGMARQRGFRFDQAKARRQSDNVLSIMLAQKQKVLELMEDEGPALSGGYALAGLDAMGYPADATITAFVRGLAARQLPAGNWHVESARPPLEYNSVAATAFVVRALALNARENHSKQYVFRISRARSWLLAQKPRFFDESVFQLLGLSWAHADSAVLKGLALALMDQQREDGGWSQQPTLQSDAYATGQALYALNQAAKVPIDSARLQRGIAFLRETQMEDGSWHVRTRAVPLQPYFESGFPYGRDQFISAAATSWAAMALMLTEPVPEARLGDLSH